MATWAYLNADGTIDKTRGLHDDDDGKSISLPFWPHGMTQLTSSQVDELYPSDAQIAHQKLQEQAKIALYRTDIVSNRCFKSGVAFPASWQTYTIALRNIVNGSDTTSTVLPTQPAYPSGT